jgi:CBS domain containing-hemolysin-like protein
MTPRPDLVTVPAHATLDEVIDLFAESGLSRLPVTGEGVDDIVGILLIRDLLPFLHHYHRAGGVKEFSATKIMREPYFVPGTKRIDDLLSEFKRRKIHLAIILDEHGGVDGLVTLEDLIEEIVGDIFDESDVAERDIVVQENGDALIDGGVLVADINDRLELTLPEGDYDTIAGFVLTSLGKLPKPGDSIVIDQLGEILQGGDETRALNGAHPLPKKQNGHSAEAEVEKEARVPRLSVTVERVKGRRIEVVRLHRFPAAENVESEAEPAASEPKAAASSSEES